MEKKNEILFYKLYNDTFNNKIDINQYKDNIESDDISNKNVIYHALFGNITIEIIESFKNNDKSEFKKFCEFVEKMWLDGDENVVNIVDVSILELLSDDEDIWKEFGYNISNEFRKYINDDLLEWNCAMWHVERLNEKENN